MRLARAPAVPGGELAFVALPDGSVLVERGPDGADPAALAGALELDPPFRAEAVHRGGSTWAVAARRIEVARLPSAQQGDEVELAWDGRERSAWRDGRPVLVGLPELERLAAERYETWVARARRLRGSLWEVEVEPL
ncbi:MAG TPA: hypothetical protein VFB26_12770 [Gaiellaceae bacterium]|nr:hypothetical protein [Gaiellaceae bacterium]